MRDTIVGSILGTLAVVFVLLLAGVGSGLLTEDPPAVSPYAGGDGPGDVTTTTASVATTTGEDSTITTGAAAEPHVVIDGFAFNEPAPVAVGTEVVVINQDGASHTWTSRDGLWDSGSLSGGDTFSFVFDSPGEYEFFCGFHSSMTGSIVVEG